MWGDRCGILNSRCHHGCSTYLSYRNSPGWALWWTAFARQDHDTRRRPMSIHYRLRNASRLQEQSSVIIRQHVADILLRLSLLLLCALFWSMKVQVQWISNYWDKWKGIAVFPLPVWEAFLLQCLNAPNLAQICPRMRYSISVSKKLILFHNASGTRAPYEYRHWPVTRFAITPVWALL